MEEVVFFMPNLMLSWAYGDCDEEIWATDVMMINYFTPFWEGELPYEHPLAVQNMALGRFIASTPTRLRGELQTGRRPTFYDVGF